MKNRKSDIQFDSFLRPKKINFRCSVNIRNQIRILLRLSFQISNIFKSFLGDHDVFTENIVKTYIQLMKFGSDIFINDPQMMKEWYVFTLTYPHVLSKVI